MSLQVGLRCHDPLVDQEHTPFPVTHSTPGMDDSPCPSRTCTICIAASLKKLRVLTDTT